MQKTVTHILTQLSAFSLLLALPVVSYSQDSYKVELGLDFSETEYPIDESKTTVLAAEIFFDDVNTGSHPYAEAAFLEHASSLGVAYVDSTFTSSPMRQDATGLLLLATYIDPATSFVLQGGLGTYDYDVTNAVFNTIDSDMLILGIGSYIDHNALLLLNYVTTDHDFSNAVSSVTLEYTDIHVSFKLVEESGDGSAYNIEASVTSSKLEATTTSETNTIIEISGDYYLDQSTSVGATFANNSGDDKGDEGKTLGVDVNIFVTPGFAVYAELSQFSADNTSGEDEDEITIGAIARF